MSDELVFRFKLPADGLALRSVALVKGVPELRFDISPKVPTITEQDVATAIRLASENKRPEFFYIPVPLNHPFYGRQYKYYSPRWLRNTSVGDLLSEADWKMKCLCVGARSDESKSKFWAWQETSQLDDPVATELDFPEDNPNSDARGSVIMSVDSVKVERKRNELMFVGEPTIKITADSNSLYSNYISKIYPTIAYDDEPLFLKMQELPKLLLAAEWLREKGIKFCKRWVFDSTTQLRPTPLHAQPVDVKGPALTSAGHNICQLVKRIPEHSHQELCSESLGPLSLDVTVEKTFHENGVEIKVTNTIQLCSPQSKPEIKEITTVKISATDYNMLYSTLDPREPLFVKNSKGKLDEIVPDVRSWSEFHSQTVPHPRIWKVPFTGCGVPTAGGGVTTSNIQVHPTCSKTASVDHKSAVGVSARKQSDTNVTKVRMPSRISKRVKRPSSDVMVKTWEAEQNRMLSKSHGVKTRYGWEDNSGARAVFDKDGNCCEQKQALRTSTEHELSINGRRVAEVTAGSSFGGIPTASLENPVGPQQAIADELAQEALSNEAQEQSVLLENQPLNEQPLEVAPTGIFSPTSTTDSSDSGFGSRSDLLDEVAQQLSDQQATLDSSDSGQDLDSGSDTPMEDRQDSDSGSDTPTED